MPGALWRALAPSLTALTWRDNRVPDAFEEVAVQAAALQVQAEPPDVHLFQAVAVPHELSALQALRELRLEYAQLDAVPPALQASVRGAAAGGPGCACAMCGAPRCPGVAAPP